MTNQSPVFTVGDIKDRWTVLFVDDLLIGSNDPQRLLKIKTKLSLIFEMKDLGEP